MFVVEFLQKNLKDNLKKCLDKRKSMTRSGAAAESLPKCKYFEQMRFLHERTSNKPSCSNVLNMETIPVFAETAPNTNLQTPTSNNEEVHCQKRKVEDTPLSS